MKKLMVFLGALILGQNISAQQQEKGIKVAPNLKLSGYAEVFYSYDFNQPADNVRQPFFYTFNRHNEFNVNIARIKANYETENMRANISVMTGTYSEDNLYNEQGALKIVEEANIGLKISKNKELWIDAGILPSYIGLEGEISKDNLTLTRTVGITQSPFFMAGVQMSYATDNQKWKLTGGVYNGWQRIRRIESNNNMPTFGTKVEYTPNDRWYFNSSTYIGKDPATESKMRYFHDFFTTFKASDKLDLQFIFDIGAEQNAVSSQKYNIWYTPNLIAKYHFTPKFSTAGRIEYYHDPKNVMGIVGANEKFQIFGASVNFDYLVRNNAMWRLEFRNLKSKDNIFIKIDETKPKVDNNFFITTTLIAWF